VPIVFDKVVDVEFIKFLVQVSEKIDSDEFLVSKNRLVVVITKTLKTSSLTSRIKVANKQINLDKLIFHRL